MSDDDYVTSYCSKCFAKICKTGLPLLTSDTDDKIEILSLKVSRCHGYFAVIAGKNMIKGKEELHQILVYKIESKDNFVLHSNLELEANYRCYSKNFDFCYRNDLPSNQCLLLLSRQEIVLYNFNEKTFKVIYEFNNDLRDQPDYASFNDN